MTGNAKGARRPRKVVRTDARDGPGRLPVVVPAEPRRCPRCHSSEIARLLYGEPRPSTDLDALLRIGRVALGGCVVGDDDPGYRCNECWSTFGSRSEELTPDWDRLPAAIPARLMPRQRQTDEWLIARLVLTGAAAPRKPKPNPVLVLDAALGELAEQGAKVRYLVTPAGFLHASVTPETPPASGWKGVQAGFDAMYRLAEPIILRRLADVLDRASGHVSYLVIGVDVYLPGHKQYAEMALVIDVEDGQPVADGRTGRPGATGKTYPTSAQQSDLVRNADVTNHVMDIAGDRVAILVCHDLVAWTGRSKKNRGEERESIARCLESEISHRRPTIALHLPHTVERTATWVSGWKEFTALAGGDLRAWTSAIAYLNLSWGRPKLRQLPPSVRHRTTSRQEDVLDIVLGDDVLID